MQILVIEDSDSTARMVQALVEGRGHAVRTAATGVQGIDSAIDHTPDVVLLDWDVQGAVAAVEICARLRKHPATRDTPIVVLGAADEEARTRALDAGAYTYYTKPFSPLGLLKELEGIARRSAPGLKVAAASEPKGD